MFEQINAVELCAVGGLSVGLIAAIICRQPDAVLALGGALGGYVGGVYSKERAE